MALIVDEGTHFVHFRAKASALTVGAVGGRQLGGCARYGAWFPALFSCAFDHVVEAAAIADAKFAVNIAYVVLGGAFCNGELVAYVLYSASTNE